MMINIGKPKKVREKPPPVPLHPPQISPEFTQD
jgi:hypothetical protein